MPLNATASLKRLVVPAAAAGVLAGLVAALLQAVLLVPLILQAEALEPAQATVGHAPAGSMRIVLTAVFDCIATVGFALLLVACYAWRGSVTWRQGAAWGAAGFASFSLSPALGLLPELPGAATGDLPARQMWWLATSLATAGGLACVAYARSLVSRLSGALLIGLPHLIGAPGSDLTSHVPQSLAHQFATRSLMVSLVVWLLLGVATAVLFTRAHRQRFPGGIRHSPG